MKKINIDMNHSSKPSAIEYRLKRAFNAASVCRQFLEGVDLLSQGIALSEARTLAGRLETLVGEIREAAPQKRVHGRKARAAAGIPEAPPKPKGKRGRPRKVPAVEAPVASLDEALQAVEEKLSVAAE
jgi:hypothetical protein